MRHSSTQAKESKRNPRRIEVVRCLTVTLSGRMPQPEKGRKRTLFLALAARNNKGLTARSND